MKKKTLKIVLLIFGLLIVGIGLVMAYVKTALPDVGDPLDIEVEGTTAQIERGRYLANNVMNCLDCHSERDWSRFAGPVVAGSEGKGGERFDQKFGFPGSYVAPNITPAALNSWTDGEIFRAITSGVSKDGRPLFPIMPHHSFGQLDEEDIKSVIAYLRTLTPIDYVPEPSYSDFPMNFIIHTIPQKAQLNPMPPKEDQVAYGKYMTTAAVCYDCHTKQEGGQFVGKDFAGGMEFPFPDGSVVRSSNITPHPTGIGSWTADQFVSRFKMYADSNYVAAPVKAGEFQTMMPWMVYAGMTEEDLRAIYAYLMTLEPVDNTVVRFSKATQ